jgi:restriction system protein
MSVPDYQSIMLPLLRLAADREEHPLRGAVEALADQFGLSDEERKELLPSGRQATFDNRVGWARTYMKKAGLPESTRPGYLKITSRGLSVVQQNPREINVDYLERFPEFVEFRSLRKVSEVDSGE